MLQSQTQIQPAPAISLTARGILSGVADAKLARSIDQAFEREHRTIRQIESVFERLTTQSWSRSTLMKFFAGWRDTHLTSTSVAALVCRLLVESEQSTAGSADFIAAAQSTGKIIHEDLGLVGETHHRLFERLANRICASDEWKLDTCVVPSARDFSQWVHQQRVSASIEEALITTIASEIYNHGEYTYIAPLFHNWIQAHHGVPAEQLRSTLAYILVHTGATESDHFLYCVEALEKYLAACGRQLDLEKVTKTCQQYLHKLGIAFAGIEDCLSEEDLPKSALCVNTLVISTAF